MQKKHDRVRKASKLARKLWREWRQVKHLQPKDFRQFLEPNQSWNKQTQIDPRCVNMRAALLMDFDFDLAAIHRFIGRNHTADHMDPDVILPRVKDLLDDKTNSNLERILRFSCPAHYNVHGTRENYEKVS